MLQVFVRSIYWNSSLSAHLQIYSALKNKQLVKLHGRAVCVAQKKEQN